MPDQDGFEPLPDDGFEPIQQDSDGFEPLAAAPGVNQISPEGMAHAASLPKEQGVQGEDPLAAVVNGLGWIGDKTRPLLNKAYEWNAKRFAPGEAAGPVTEMLSRSMLSAGFGDKINEEMPDERRYKAINSMEQTIGEGGTTAALTGMQTVGQIPQMMVGLGWAKKGANAAKALNLEGKVLPKLVKLGAEAAGAGAENVVLGGAQRALKGEEQEPLQDFAGGALLHQVGAGGEILSNKLLNAPKGSRARKFGELLTADLGKAITGKARRVGAVIGGAIDHLADELDFFQHEIPSDIPNPKFLKGPTLSFGHEVRPGGDGIIVTAMTQDGRQVGRAVFGKREGGWEPDLITVDPAYRRQGVASQIYQHTEMVTGQRVHPSDKQSDAGAALWKGMQKKGTIGPREPLQGAPNDNFTMGSAKGGKVVALPEARPGEQYVDAFADTDKSMDARTTAEKDPHFGEKVRPGALEPSVILLHTNETGGVVASVNEFRSDGTRKYYDVEINTPEDAMKIGKLADEKKLAVGLAADAMKTVANMPNEMLERLYFRNNRPLLAPDSTLKGTAPIRKSLPSLDKPPPRLGAGDASVVVSDTGHIKLEPIQHGDYDVHALPEKGDAVQVIGRGGQRYTGTYHGINPVTGEAVVHAGVDTEDLGSIIHVSPDQVVKIATQPDVAPPVPPEMIHQKTPQPPKKGAYGFIANPDGGYIVVQIVGPGEKPGTTNVTLGPGGSVLPISTAKVESRLPPGIESFDELVPAQPDAPPPDAVAGMSPEDHEEISAAKRVFETLSKKGQGVWEKVTQQLLGGQVRGSKTMQFIHLRNQGSQALLKAEGDMFSAVEKQLPKGAARKVFNDDLGQVAEGKMKWEDMVKKYGDAVTDQLKKVTGNFMEGRDANDKRIAELGGIPDRLVLERAEGLLDPYLARGYMVHLLPPGEWAKIVPKQHPEVFRRAVEYLVKDLSEGGTRHVLPEQVSAELETLLKAPNTVEALKSSGLKDARAFKKLLAKQDIPAEIRAVMGEVTAGSVRMASTMGSQEAIIAKLELFQSIATDPNLSSVGRRADLHPEPVPDIPRLYGKLAGRYVKPEIYNELINLPNSVRNMYTFANQVANWVKGNQLMGPGPWWTSLSGNLQGGVYSGGLSFLRPDRYVQDVVGALKSLSHYHADPTGRTGEGWLVKEAKKLGADFSGRGEVEISSHSKKFVKEMLATLESEPKGAWSFVTAAKKMAEKYQSVQGMFGRALDFQDQVFRLASYRSLRRKFLAEGMTPEAAGLTAASRVVNSFPNPEHLGEAVKTLRTQVGIAAPYLTPKAEDLRIHALLPKRMLNEPDLKYRLLGHAILFGGLAKMMAHLSGVSSESIADAQESMTKRHKSFKPALVPLITRDDAGRVQFIDTTNWFLPGQLLQGHPDDPWFKRVAYNVATYPLEGSLLQDATDSMAEAGGYKRPVGEPRLLEGEGNNSMLMDKLFKAGFGPRYAGTLLDLGRKTMVGGTYEQPQTLGPGQLGRNEEPLTPGQGLAGAAGLRVSGAGERGFRAATMEAVGELRSLSGSQLVQLWSSTRDLSEKQRITTAIIERIKLLGQQRNNAGALHEAQSLAQFLSGQ